MTDAEYHEKIRQAIMRYRELLDLLEMRRQQGEQAYTKLLSGVPAEVRATLPEKAVQGEAAKLALADLTPLRRAVLFMQFEVRELERAFEELYGKIAETETK